MAKNIKYLSSFAWFCFLCFCLLILPHCPPPQQCNKDNPDISDTILNTKDSPCEKRCDCNNQRYEGYCSNSKCISQQRESCEVAGKVQECTIQPEFRSFAGSCTKGTRICKDKGMSELYWGDCTCSSIAPDGGTKDEPTRSLPIREICDDTQCTEIKQCKLSDNGSCGKGKSCTQAPDADGEGYCDSVCGGGETCPKGFICNENKSLCVPLGPVKPHEICHDMFVDGLNRININKFCGEKLVCFFIGGGPLGICAKPTDSCNKDSPCKEGEICLPSPDGKTSYCMQDCTNQKCKGDEAITCVDVGDFGIKGDKKVCIPK